MKKRKRMPEESREPEGPPATGGAPFDARFFATVLPGRVRNVCHGKADQLPVVLLHLGGESVLDLCHIEQLAPRWMAASVFRTLPTCAEMDLVFVPYELIFRITVSSRAITERRVGFQPNHEKIPES